MYKKEKNLPEAINAAWEKKDEIKSNNSFLSEVTLLVNDVISLIETGGISVASKGKDGWYVNQWIKKAILLNFYVSDFKIFESGCHKWYDKIEPKFLGAREEELKAAGCRIVPGAFIRKGAYIAKNTVIMPSFINIGASIGEGTLIDSWATVGSCANIGKNCHISGGVGIGGVLEPLQSSPVIIEDNCFIGARSEIVEGVIVGEGSVLGMGVFIGSSTKIVYRDSGEVIYGRIPPYSVVVPGSMPSTAPGIPSLYCAIIIKKVDEKTRSKTSLNELLRD